MLIRQINILKVFEMTLQSLAHIIRLGAPGQCLSPTILNITLAGSHLGFSILQFRFFR